jgi:hypothetical protein
VQVVLIHKVTTKYVALVDDDHVATAQTNLTRMAGLLEQNSRENLSTILGQ